MKKIILSIFTSCLALAAPAQGVFEASLGTPPGDGGARLILGDFWVQVVNNELEFKTIVSPSIFTSNFNPVLSVPGSSLEFSLGEAQTGFISSRTDPDWNPFLPPKPLVPTGYDDDGNPYFISTLPVVQLGDYYIGHFTLPPGFLDELLAGNGKIELNPSLVGNISITPTPEPTTLTLGLLGIGFLLFVRWRKRAVG
jgi:hypothetical protein